MSFATSQPIVNRYLGGGDVATTLRTHLLANNANRPLAKVRTVALAVAATVRIHPIRLARILRRGSVRAAFADLIN